MITWADGCHHGCEKIEVLGPVSYVYYNSILNERSKGNRS